MCKIVLWDQFLFPSLLTLYENTYYLFISRNFHLNVRRCTGINFICVEIDGISLIYCPQKQGILLPMFSYQELYLILNIRHHIFEIVNKTNWIQQITIVDFQMFNGVIGESFLNGIRYTCIQIFPFSIWEFCKLPSRGRLVSRFGKFMSYCIIIFYFRCNLWTCVAEWQSFNLLSSLINGHNNLHLIHARVRKLKKM